MTPAQEARWAKTTCSQWALEAGIPLEQQIEDLEDLRATIEVNPDRIDLKEWLMETWGIEPDHALDLMEVL